MPEHKQTHIKVGEREADVDTKLADLITNIWKLDIDTALSCQDNNGVVWICFPTSYDAEKFLNYVAEYSEDTENSMYHRILNKWDGTKSPWKYDVGVDDLGLTDIYDEQGEDILREEFDGEHMFLFSVSIRFPRSDLKLVEQKIQQQVHNLLHNQVNEEINNAPPTVS